MVCLLPSTSTEKVRGPMRGPSIGFNSSCYGKNRVSGQYYILHRHVFHTITLFPSMPFSAHNAAV